MKVKAIIEEVISQEFEVEVDSVETAHEEIRKRYRNGEMVVEDATLLEAHLLIVTEDGKEHSWNNIHG